MIHEQRLHEEMLLRQSILDQELEERRLDRRDRDDSEDEIETNAIRNSIARKSANLKNRLSLVDELRASSYVNEYNSPRRVSRSVIPEDRHSLSHNDIDSYENDRYDHRANSVIGSSFSKSRRESFIDDLPRQTRKSLIEDDFRRQSNSRKSLVLDDFPRQSFSRKSFTNDVAQRDSYAKLDEVRKSILNAREIEDSPIKIRNITDDESISVDEQPNDDQHSILSRYEHSINDHDNQVDDGIMNSPVSEKELPVVILKKKGKRVVESDESENEVPKMKRKENRKKVTVAPRGRSRSVSGIIILI